MSCPRARLFFALIVSMVAGLACADYGTPTSPTAIQQKLLPPTATVRTPFSVVPKGLKAVAVRWGAGHESVDQSVSAVIGTEGGTLSIPRADFSMTIPAGALDRATRITVVTRAGTYVVYDMYPHGLRFRRPVLAVQGLATVAGYGTRALSSVRSAYLPAGHERISRDGSARATELQAVTTYFSGAEPLAESQEWILNHFSRYILVSGVWMETDEPEGGSDVESIRGPAIQVDSLETGAALPVDSPESAPVVPVDSLESDASLPIEPFGSR